MKKFFALLIMILSMSGALAQSNISSEGCTTGIDRCAPPPQPHPCPAGMQWSTMGTGIAHCVANTPICTGGTQLQVDSNGNPSCVPPPTCANGATNYPACTSFPTCPNGATNYPACTSFPTCPNGATNYPACNAVPTCPNGATNYPACNAVPTCPNGASDYPTCTPPVTSCANGAPNYPVCSVVIVCNLNPYNSPNLVVLNADSNNVTYDPNDPSISTVYNWSSVANLATHQIFNLPANSKATVLAGFVAPGAIGAGWQPVTTQYDDGTSSTVLACIRSGS